MAINKTINKRTNTHGAMRNCIEYVLRQDKTRVSVQWWGDDRQVSQSGKPLCTGASLWAVPKLAMGVCPLEPRHANGDNSVLEISTGYFFSDCHGLAKTLSCIYQRGTLHIPLWNPLLI